MTKTVSKQQIYAAKKTWFDRETVTEKLFNYTQNIKGDYRWLLMFVCARFPIGRNLGVLFYRYKKDRHSTIKSINTATERCWKTSQVNRKRVNKDNSIFKNIDLNLAVESIKERGYFLGLQLPDCILQEILAYAYYADISIDGDRGWEFKYSAKKEAEQHYNRNILIGNYLAINTECSAMQKLAGDPQLKEVATKYLGTEPVLVRSQMGWTFVGSKNAYAQKGEIGSPTVSFHYDLDDYRALKFFFYLTDVDSSSGSHRCVDRSHKKRKLLHCIFRSQSDREIADYYGAKSIVNICGRAGYGFAEDPFCFHRGSPPISKPRLMIQLEFALNEYGTWQQ